MREYLRKSIHLAFGLGISALMITLERDMLLILFSIALLIGFLISDAVTRGYRIFFISPMLDLVDRKDAIPGKGALFFLLSALISLTLFPLRIAFLSVLALSLVDGVATIAGRTWGRTKIARGKSLEGSFAGAFLAFGAFLFFLPFGQAALLAVFAAAVELFSPVDDNLVIPIAAGFFLQLLG
jgi:phytol kinase